MKKILKMFTSVLGTFIILIILVVAMLLCFERSNFSNIGGVEKREFSCYRDDFKICGTIFLPKEIENEKLPVAVVCHEFMANRLLSFPYAYTLAKNGYVAFCFDFCGGGFFSQSDGESTDMSVLTEKADLYAVLDFAKEQSFADETDILLMGCSQGGMVCALTAAEMKDQIKGLILQYPALSIPDDARKGSMIKAKFDPKHIPNQLNCGPMKLGKQYVTDVMNMDIYDLIAGYTGKILLLHGDDDTLVDISYSEKAYQVYQENGCDIRFEVVTGAGHIFINPEHIQKAQKNISAFVQDLNR